MVRSTSSVRRGLSALLSASLSWSAVAVPMLEIGSLLGASSAVESQHDASKCRHGHDHRICTQVGANRSLTTPMSAQRLDHFVVRVAPPGEAPSSPHGSLIAGPRSRAPPLA